MTAELRPRHTLVRDRRIAYVEAGDGPRTALLIHGYAASWKYWLHTIPALARTHRVVAIDLPGFGDSEDPDAHGFTDQLDAIHAFLDAVGIDRCDVVGHSMGTLVACELAARHPDRVDRVVLTGGPISSVIGLFRNPLGTLKRHPEVATFIVEALTAGSPPSPPIRRLITTQRWARWAALRAYVPHPWALDAEDVARILDGAGPPAAWPTLRQGFRYDERPALAAVTQPTIVINGARDTISPPADARAFAAANDAVEAVHLIPDVGHIPMIESPTAFNEHLTRFLASPAVADRRSRRAGDRD
ncbi:alpha/beta hydrolase [Tsukamurella sp. 8F]|uniref:alpha/beta fold hydrolase n=1 Tax=unclassified Tsukamurella TaxID=2633480 RepID=UPI0023BA0F1F|nr:MULTISPECIES: alpha/beta hydrolase [unclassified Tsukamurella]MDF0531888.1 alpha/beta hydrolase [Tsukamurella sp. 8J]MDF0589122.1 alpha/beta hydrolase [Tsukamurella sp. 8F]